MPMPALLLPALFSALPGIAGLFGGNPQAKLRRQANRLLASQGNLTNQFYNQAIASPAFAQAQGSIAAGANAAGGQLASSLAQRGIGTSGSAAVLSSLMPSLVGSQQAGLRTSAYQGAQNQAQQQIQQQLQLLLGTQGPSPAQQGFAGGINAFAPFLQQYLGAKYPNIFGTSTTGARA